MEGKVNHPKKNPDDGRGVDLLDWAKEKRLYQKNTTFKITTKVKLQKKN
jgi:hypothetical protein